MLLARHAPVLQTDGESPSVSLLDGSVSTLCVQAALLQVFWISVHPKSPSRLVPASLVFRRQTSVHPSYLSTWISA